MRIAIVAGELSGDVLGASLIHALKRYYPESEIVGVAGSKMQAAGCKSLFPMERLSVMGASEVLRRLPDLLRARRHVIQYFLENKPDIFIGIDAPDFNLTVEATLRRAGIPTVHYVSPSVWAWRKGRIRKIKRSVDLMLTLFPFEQAIYTENHIPVEFVGHPLADRYAQLPSKDTVRQSLGISSNEIVIALLPGSRAQEIAHLGQVFIHVAKRCKETLPNLRVIIPAANPMRHKEITDLVDQSGIRVLCKVDILSGEVDKAVLAADAALATSGTVTLEAMLLGCPMVVAYRFAPLSWWIAKTFVKLPYVSLPNLLAQRFLVEEYLQDDASEENLTTAVMKLLTNPELSEQMRTEFAILKQSLQRNAAENAAIAIKKTLDTHS